MEIRLATINDVEKLCPLFTEFFAYNAELQPMYCSASNENGEYPKKVIEREYSDILIAVENDVIVGFMHIKQMETPLVASVVHHHYAEIMAFMVTASHRERGIGSMLMDAAKQWSNSRNLEYIELFSLSNADEANKFYDSKDFVTVSHTRRFAL